MRYSILRDVWYFPPFQTCIDHEKWKEREADGKGPSTYFVTDFSEPPIIPGREAEVIKFLVGQLTYEQFQQQLELQFAKPDIEPRLNLDWLRYICRAGIRDVSGFEIVDETGKTTPVALTFEDTPRGRMMTDESFRLLVPFSWELLRLVASICYYISQARL